MFLNSATEQIDETQLVHVPAGSFLLGTSDQQINELARKDDDARRWKEKGFFSREQPQQNIFLNSFLICKYPVSVGEYRRFINAGIYKQKQYWTEPGWAWLKQESKEKPEYWENPQWTGDDKLPVVGVSWYEAVAFCQWLSHVTGRKCCLPTEAQWEKAARGREGWIYSWGNEFDKNLCHSKMSELKRTVPVNHYGIEAESPFGCAMMLGNVSEWTRSQYKPYPYDEEDGRNNLEGEKLRVIRGGSWYSPLVRVRAAARGFNDPHFTDNDVGFRCICCV